MLRPGPLRGFLRPMSSRPADALSKRFVSTGNARLAHPFIRQGALIPKRAEPLALTAYRPSMALVRQYATIRGLTRDPALEQKYSEKILRPRPESVSAHSSTQPVFDSSTPDDDPDMMAGVRHDLTVIQETFALHEVPRQALVLGLAGVLPYLATSFTTIFCATEIHRAETYGTGYMLSGETAELLLNAMQPIQIGYGAVILSFLGAIHWGLEWAGYGGYQGYRRYSYGVVAPAVAWPTILMPVEHALITQFLAFSFLYSVDSGAAAKGWVPPWYGTYRFVLTFIVGASIVATLIGRGQIADRIGRLPTPTERILALRKDPMAVPEEGEGEGEAEE